MEWTLITALLFAAIIIGLITYLLTRRHYHLQVAAISRELADAKTALSTVQADFSGRQEELRNSINEAVKRENEAKTKAGELEQRFSAIDAELKLVLQEKGKFQNEAARITEIKAVLLERDGEIQGASDRVCKCDELPVAA